MERIRFIGLGNMGMPMALNLVKAGYDVQGFDLNSTALQRFAGAGGRPAADLAAAVSAADVVITMLPSGAEVRSTYLSDPGILKGAATGSLLIDCSTIDVETARAVALEALSKGLAMLDAPVSGGVSGAERATLTFMVGGTPAAFARARPVLEAMGTNVLHAGASASGQAAKICNNLILGISMIAVSEAFVLAEKLGLEHHKLFDISSRSSGQCWSLTSYCPVPGPVPSSPANNGYRPGFTAAMMLKDLKLAQDAARTAGASTPLGAAAAALFSLYVGQGASGRDFSAIVEFLRGC